MKVADKIPCEVLYAPLGKMFDEEIRLFQGCPTIAISKGGRIFMGWYAGGDCEPHMENYNLIVYSDDGGLTFTPLLVIPSSKERFVHSLDIQLWTAPDGKLHCYWVQNDTRLAEEGDEGLIVAGYLHDDFRHAEWRMICDDPDAESPRFGEPEYLDSGFLRCKPLVTSSGRILNFNYDQLSDRYGYSYSDDGGKTYTHRYGSEKIDTPFDETMAYQMKDGTIRMLARATVGELAESYSHDDGWTWTPTQKSGIVSPSSRFYISRTPTGRVLLVTNDHPQYRMNVTVSLSEDDGKTWPYRQCIDPRPGTSYPDVDFYDGRVYLTYDRGRCEEREILFADFTEGELIQGTPITPRVISKSIMEKSKEEEK